MKNESSMEQQVEETAPNLAHSPTDKVPDDTWPTEILLDFAMKALGEGDKLEKRLHALARKSVITKFRAGHAFAILQERLTTTGDWCKFQAEHDLPRTNVWQVTAVYQKATAMGHGEEDIAMYGTWTEVMVAYGVGKPRKAKVEQHRATTAKSGADDDDAGDGAQGDDGEPEEDEDVSKDGDDDESESLHGEPAEEPPPVTEEQLIAADSFVAAVGGMGHAARALVAGGIRSGDKDVVKDTVVAVVRAARAILTLSEITAIVIVGNAKEKGFKGVSV